ncbi:MAG: hypothetical protein GX633_10675 [Clostridiales bacterium]|nr:hypothetical protein [Clostridiales bacterium]
MNYPLMRQELIEYYRNVADDKAEKFFIECTELLDRTAREDMTVFEQKVHQYRTISEEFDPVIFHRLPYYYETGTMSAHCDGARDFRNNKKHAGGWTYRRNAHLFIDQDKDLWARRCAQTGELLYLICGPYNDSSQHFLFNYRPVFESGLKGVYDRCISLMEEECTEGERQYLSATAEGMLCLKRMAEKFSEKAASMLAEAPDEEARRNLELIRDTAKRVPWERPETFYEAINTYAFLRKAMGSLEGIGFNTFGRVDKDLYPYYTNDIAGGILTPESAYDLICRFIIMFDLHYDHNMKMVGYADHELENTYTIGGYGDDGKPVCNQLTLMFLRAAREEKTIYPKIKCRYSSDSPKEYFDEINKAVIAGTSVILYQNDESTIPALVNAGRTYEEAREYVMSGCWGINCPGVEKTAGGCYLNMLKPFEFSIHRLTDRMDKTGIMFEILDGCESFEEVYSVTMENIRRLLVERADITIKGGRIWDKVDPLPLMSSTLQKCLETKRDFTQGGAKYRDDRYLCFGLPNIVDSLLAIRELCFEQKKYTLMELLDAVRANWEGFEDMRLDCVRCHGWGDGSPESGKLANRMHSDLCKYAKGLTSTFGGKVNIGHITYTEIRHWGEKTLATPDGRKSFEYFAQGLTPSRLKKIPSVTSVVNSMMYLDGASIGGNSVLNVILPSNNMSLDRLEAFLRVTAKSAVQSLQLNCTTKEQLLDAQKHPEKYPDLIVRVTGFSAKFTSLSPEWQQEVLTRNFYE